MTTIRNTYNNKVLEFRHTLSTFLITLFDLQNKVNDIKTIEKQQYLNELYGQMKTLFEDNYNSLFGANFDLFTDKYLAIAAENEARRNSMNPLKSNKYTSSLNTSSKLKIPTIRNTYTNKVIEFQNTLSTFLVNLFYLEKVMQDKSLSKHNLNELYGQMKTLFEDNYNSLFGANFDLFTYKYLAIVAENEARRNSMNPLNPKKYPSVLRESSTSARNNLRDIFPPHPQLRHFKKKTQKTSFGPRPRKPLPHSPLRQTQTVQSLTPPHSNSNSNSRSPSPTKFEIIGDNSGNNLLAMPTKNKNGRSNSK